MGSAIWLLLERKGSSASPKWTASAPCSKDSTLVRSHVHPHAHRRLGLKGSSSWFLLSLSEACCAHSLHRLGELVDQELFDRQAAAPAVALDPEMEKLIPY